MNNKYMHPSRRVIILIGVVVIFILPIFLFISVDLSSIKIQQIEEPRTQLQWEGTQVVEIYGNGDKYHCIFPCQFSRCDSKQRQHWQKVIYEGIWEPSIWFRNENVVHLCNAILDSNYRLAENIIRDNGVDINTSGKEGINILFWSMFCNLDQIEFLLKNGASPNFIVKSNCRLHLIGYGESDTIFKDKSFLSMLIYLSHFEPRYSTHRIRELVKLLLKYGADPNYNDRKGLIVYSSAFKSKDQYSLMRLLIASGYDVERGYLRVVPYYPPSAIDDEEVDPLLLSSGYFCDLNTHYGSRLLCNISTILSEGILSLDERFMKKMKLDYSKRTSDDPGLNADWERSRSMYSRAIAAGRYAKILSSQGVNICDSVEYKENFNFPLTTFNSISQIIIQEVDASDSLIYLSRFLNSDDITQDSAIEEIYSTVWKPETCFSDKDLIQLCRVITSQNPMKIAKHLKSSKVNLLDRSKSPLVEEMPVLFWSFFCGEDVIKTLLESGIDPNVVLESDYNIISDSIMTGSTLLYVSLMWSNYHIESRSFFKNYPRLLLEHGALATERGEESPLLLALRFRNPTVEKGGYLDLDTIKLLIQNGANVNFTSRNGKYTPVSTAAQKFDFIALEALLEHGATVDVSTFPGRETQRALCYYRDKLFRSPLYDAEIRRPYDDAFLRVVELLERQGVSFNEPAAIEDDWERDNACSITRRLLQDIYSDGASADADASESEQSNGE